MRLENLPTKLRELADEIEAAELPDCSVQLHIASYDLCEKREELAAWARLIGGNIRVVHSDDSVWLKCQADGVEWTKFFTPGLLGGKEQVIVKDDAAGLDVLRAEFAESAVTT